MVDNQPEISDRSNSPRQTRTHRTHENATTNTYRTGRGKHKCTLQTQDQARPQAMLFWTKTVDMIFKPKIYESM